MIIEDFFEQFVDGYLLNDLRSMQAVTVPVGQTSGGVGYPMISTVLAGMELLGELLMSNTNSFDPNRGNDYFLNYWNNYFAIQNPAYVGLGGLFRQLMRNGISHTFVAKPGIFVEKGTNRQMSIDTTRQELYVDCIVFFKEFEESYLKLVRPVLEGTAASPTTTKQNIQTRLDDLATAYSNDSARLFAGLSISTPTIDTSNRSQVPVSPFFANIGIRASGASGLTQEQAAALKTSSVAEQGTATIPSTTVSGTLQKKQPIV